MILRAIATKGIIKLSLTPNELTTTKLIVPTPLPYINKISFETSDQGMLLKAPTPPRTIDTNFNLELTILEIEFQKIISFKYKIKRKSLFTYKNKVESYLKSYESHILVNNQSDPHTIHNLFNSVTLWNKTTILKNLIKSRKYHHRLNLLMRIRNKKSPLYKEYYDLVYGIFVNQMRAMNNIQYYSDNLDIYLQQTDVATLWNQLKG